MRRKLTDVELPPDARDVQQDQHVRAYYDQPANDFEEYASSRFEGETVALAKAYQVSLDGFADDEFGDVDEGGFFARVLFDACPFIVCFCVDSQGFVSEIDNREYEAIWAQYIEESESSDDENEGN